jgi:Spy/CpxP family protein refolding chaperone
VGSASGTGTSTGVGANGTVTISAVGSASGSSVVLGVSPSHGGGTGKGQNLSRKQKKKLKAVESQEWLKAEETARQLLNDRFTKQTPQEKAEALQTYVESLQPVIEALKALTSPEVKESEESIVELTPHQEILTRFDTLEKKLKSVEELVIILMADL